MFHVEIRRIAIDQWPSKDNQTILFGFTIDLPEQKNEANVLRSH